MTGQRIGVGRRDTDIQVRSGFKKASFHQVCFEVPDSQCPEENSEAASWISRERALGSISNDCLGSKGWSSDVCAVFPSTSGLIPASFELRKKGIRWYPLSFGGREAKSHQSHFE